MSNFSEADQSFMTRLADLTGANVSKVASLRNAKVTAHEVEPEVPAQEDSATKIASMSMKEIMDHPAFLEGFQSQLSKRMPEIDAAVAQLITE